MSRKKTFRFSKSSLSSFEDTGMCMEKWRGMARDKEFSTPTTEAMWYGIYFEALVLGEQVLEEGETMEMVRKKLPTKSVFVTRVEKQAAMVQAYLEKRYEIIDRQLTLSDDLMKGVIDVVLRNKETGMIEICDLKHTYDLSNDRGPYQWADETRIDPIQLIIYGELYKHSDLDGLFYLITDRSPLMRRKRINVKVTEEGRAEAINRINEAYESLSYYNEEGFPVKPTFRNCLDCALECPYRIAKDGVEEVSITV